MLEEITRIPVPVLKMEKPFSDYGIAQRMSWAAARKTTKEEDEAYSLMGLFSIKIPVLYGEGRQAFQRLQEEIVKKDIDTSLFAWDWEDGGSRDDSSQSSMSVQDYKHKSYLFAASPSDFRECKAVSFNTVADMTSQERWWFDRKLVSLPSSRSSVRSKVSSYPRPTASRQKLGNAEQDCVEFRIARPSLLFHLTLWRPGSCSNI